MVTAIDSITLSFSNHEQAGGDRPSSSSAKADDPVFQELSAQQAPIQQAQAGPQGPPQQPPATGAGQPDAGAPAAGGVLSPLTENGRVDSYVYKKFSTGTPPAGPQVTAAESNRKITATDNANRTNFGGVYGHTLTYSEPDTDNLLTINAADPTGLLVAMRGLTLSKFQIIMLGSDLGMGTECIGITASQRDRRCRIGIDTNIEACR